MLYEKTTKNHYNVRQFKEAPIIATIDNVTGKEINAKPCYIVTFNSGISYSETTLIKAHELIYQNATILVKNEAVFEKFTGGYAVKFNEHIKGIIHKSRYGYIYQSRDDNKKIEFNTSVKLYQVYNYVNQQIKSKYLIKNVDNVK